MVSWVCNEHWKLQEVMKDKYNFHVLKIYYRGKVRIRGGRQRKEVRDSIELGLASFILDCIRNDGTTT